jgi:hypothetical protein
MSCKDNKTINADSLSISKATWPVGRHEQAHALEINQAYDKT